MAKRNDVKTRRTKAPSSTGGRGNGGRRGDCLPLTPKQRLELIDRVGAGETFVGIYKSMKITTNQMLKTLDIDRQFEVGISNARRLRAYSQADRAERITGHFFNDDGTVDKSTKTVDKEEVGLRRNAAEHLRWEAERAHPDAFGTKVDLGAHDMRGKSWADLAKDSDE